MRQDNNRKQGASKLKSGKDHPQIRAADLLGLKDGKPETLATPPSEPTKKSPDSKKPRIR